MRVLPLVRLSRYIYTDEIDVDDRCIFGLLYASSKYMIDNVRQSILNYITTSADTQLALQAVIHQALIPDAVLETSVSIYNEFLLEFRVIQSEPSSIPIMNLTIFDLLLSNP